MESKEKKLKSCPFCGNDNIGIQKVDGNWQCYCIPCWANRGWFDDKETAIFYWNKRKEKL